MPKLMSFVCPELDATYDEVYRELALHLEMPVADTIKRFGPDDAVTRLKYHRRQASRRAVFTELAGELGIDAATVFSAVSADGAHMLLEAIRERRAAAV
jgi:hypothetical protein